MFVRYFDFLCCVACGLYLCAECNFEAVESSQDYMCGECAPGSVPDPQVEGRCQRVENIDTQDDLSNGDDNTGKNSRCCVRACNSCVSTCLCVMA